MSRYKIATKTDTLRYRIAKEVFGEIEDSDGVRDIPSWEIFEKCLEQHKLIKELEHRLSNCIEPKFKKGDLVFANTVAYWENEKPVRHTTEQEVEEIIYFYKLKNYDFKNWEIDEVFSTYNEAKEKLNEIQGDKR